MILISRKKGFPVAVAATIALGIIQVREVSSHSIWNRPVVTEFSTLYGRFSRTFERNNNAETIKGEFYYSASGRIMVEVSSPLHQIMIIEANITTIYYPESKKAFRLESANPVILPLVPGLMAAIRSDYGLAEIGFKLLNQQMHGDTVICLWSHPKERDKIGDFKIAQVNDRLAYTFHESPDSLNRSKTMFSNYIAVSGIFFPTDIFSEIHSLTGNSKERVTLSELKMDAEIPPHITNFRIPEDVIVEKKKW